MNDNCALVLKAYHLPDSEPLTFHDPALGTDGIAWERFPIGFIGKIFKSVIRIKMDQLRLLDRFRSESADFDEIDNPRFHQMSLLYCDCEIPSNTLDQCRRFTNICDASENAAHSIEQGTIELNGYKCYD
jgi:hypothetical protein